jgi:hypothetical protein
MFTGAPMFRFLRGVTLIAMMSLNGGAAFAEIDSSANYMMPGCHHFLQPDARPTDARVYLIAAKCEGLVEGLAYERVCFPSGVISGQVLRVVVNYIDDQPARLHEDFKLLALEALRAAWSCKK